MSASSRTRGTANLGPARAERGMVAFLREIERAQRTTREDDAAVQARSELQDWLLADASPAALLIAPSGRGKSTLLASWAVEVARGKAWDVVFLPVRRDFGTALERSVLGLAYVRLAPLLETKGYGPLPFPYGTTTLRDNLAWSLAERRDPSEGDPQRPVLLILDGIEDACDWATSAETLFVRRLAPHVRLVVSAPSQEWVPGDVPWREGARVIHLGPSTEGEAPARGQGGSLPADALECLLRDFGAQARDAAAVLRVLARALGPLSPRELGVVAGLDEAVAADLAHRLSLAVRRECGVAVRDAAWRERIDAEMTSDERSAIDRRLLGLGILGSAEARADRDDSPDYACEHRGAHLQRAGSRLTEQLALMTPQWLDVWRGRSDVSLGFVTDVERVFHGAGEELLRGVHIQSVATRAAAIEALARCLLTQVSLHELAVIHFRSERRDAQDAQDAQDDEDDASREDVAEEVETPLVPLGHEVLDFEQRIRDGGARALALVHISQHLMGPDRPTVLAWALDAARKGDGRGPALAAIARASSGSDRLAIAREAAAALRAEAAALGSALEDWIEVARLLPEPEAYDLAQDAMCRAVATEYGAEDPASLAKAAASLPPAVVMRLAEWAETLPAPASLVVMARLASGLPTEVRQAGLARTLIAVLSFPNFAYDGDAQWALGALAPRLDEHLLRKAIAFDETEQKCFGGVTVALAARAAELGLEETAMSVVRRIQSLSVRAEGFVRLLPLLPPDRRAAVWQEVQRLAQDWDAPSQRLLQARAAGPVSRSLGVDAILPWVRASGNEDSLSLMVPLIEGASADKEALTSELVARVEDLTSESGDYLFQLVRLAPWMDLEAACRLTRRLFSYFLSHYPERERRRNVLDDWTGVNFANLAPLVSRVAGEPGLVALARQVVDVGEWFP